MTIEIQFTNQYPSINVPLSVAPLPNNFYVMFVCKSKTDTQPSLDYSRLEISSQIHDLAMLTGCSQSHMRHCKYSRNQSLARHGIPVNQKQLHSQPRRCVSYHRRTLFANTCNENWDILTVIQEPPGHRYALECHPNKIVFIKNKKRRPPSL